MNRRGALLACCGLAACASVPADTTPEYSNEELTAALQKALEYMQAQDLKIEEQGKLLQKMHDRLAAECNYS